MVGVNRVGAAGTAKELEHLGDSVVIDPLGRRLVEAAGVETVLLAEVSADTVRAVRAQFPFLADRRGAPTPVHAALSEGSR